MVPSNCVAEAYTYTHNSSSHASSHSIIEAVVSVQPSSLSHHVAERAEYFQSSSPSDLCGTLARMYPNAAWLNCGPSLGSTDIKEETFRRFIAAQSSLFSCAAKLSCALTWRCSSSLSSPRLRQQCPWILDSLLKVCYCECHCPPTSDAYFRQFQPSRKVQMRTDSSVRDTTYDCTLFHRRGAILNPW